MYMQAMVCVKPRKQETLSCVASYQTIACMYTISSDHCLESFKSGHFVLRGQEPSSGLVAGHFQASNQLVCNHSNSETLCTYHLMSCFTPDYGFNILTTSPKGTHMQAVIWSKITQAVKYWAKVTVSVTLNQVLACVHVTTADERWRGQPIFNGRAYTHKASSWSKVS